MTIRDRTLRDERITLIEEDDRVRARLSEEGSLFDGYHPDMAAVHRHNANRVRSMFAEKGWPRKTDIGSKGMSALWRIVQHAIADPGLQRCFFAHLTTLVGTADDAPRERAMLDDRIRVFEGRPQRYGTQFDWSDDGSFGLMGSLEDADSVDERRAQVGLKPLEEALARQRRFVDLESRPSDLRARQAGFEQWARNLGWR